MTGGAGLVGGNLTKNPADDPRSRAVGPEARAPAAGRAGPSAMGEHGRTLCVDNLDTGTVFVPGRPVVHGKFLSAGGQKLWVKGVAYGTFRPNAAGEQFPEADGVRADFAAMADRGINTVRTYTVPPRSLLDAAADNGLRVLVGIPWEQHVAFLGDRSRVRSIERRVGGGVRACAGHAAVLGYSVGNEIPAPIVRWHGRRRVERFRGCLYEMAKEEDPSGLVTYVNFPSTEYLELPFPDHDQSTIGLAALSEVHTPETQ